MVLLGSDDKSTEFPGIDNIDFDSYIDDFQKNNWGIVLLGKRNVPLDRYHKFYREKGIVLPKEISPIEWSVLFHDNEGFSNGKIQTDFFFGEISPVYNHIRLFKRNRIFFNEFNGINYGLIDTLKSGYNPLRRDENGLFVDETCLLPYGSKKPFPRAFIDKKEFKDIFSFFPNESDPDYYKKRIFANSNLHSRLSEIFKYEDVSAPKPIYKFKVPKDQRKLPIFTLRNMKGNNFIEKTYRNPLEKFFIFGFGGDENIRTGLTGNTQHYLHFGMTLLSIAAFRPSMDYFMNHPSDPLSLAYISSSFGLFADSLFRIYKNVSDSDNRRSGFMGEMKDRIFGKGPVYYRG